MPELWSHIHVWDSWRNDKRTGRFIRDCTLCSAHEWQPPS